MTTQRLSIRTARHNPRHQEHSHGNLTHNPLESAERIVSQQPWSSDQARSPDNEFAFDIGKHSEYSPLIHLARRLFRSRRNTANRSSNGNRLSPRPRRPTLGSKQPNRQYERCHRVRNFFLTQTVDPRTRRERNSRYRQDPNDRSRPRLRENSKRVPRRFDNVLIGPKNSGNIEHTCLKVPCCKSASGVFTQPRTRADTSLLSSRRGMHDVSLHTLADRRLWPAKRTPFCSEAARPLASDP